MCSLFLHLVRMSSLNNNIMNFDTQTVFSDAYESSGGKAEMSVRLGLSDWALQTLSLQGKLTLRAPHSSIFGDFCARAADPAKMLAAVRVPVRSADTCQRALKNSCIWCPLTIALPCFP